MKRILDEFMLIVDYDERTEKLHIRNKHQSNVVVTIGARFEGTSDLTIKLDNNQPNPYGTGIFLPCDGGFHVTTATGIKLK